MNYDWSKKSGDVSSLCLPQRGNTLGLGWEVEGLHWLLKLQVRDFCFAESVCLDGRKWFSYLFLWLFDDHHGKTTVIDPLTIWQFRWFSLRVIFLLYLLLLFCVIEVELDVVSVGLYTELTGPSSYCLHGIIDVFLLSNIVGLNSKAFTFFSSSNF